MFYLTIVRHGESVYNSKQLLQGQLDVELSEMGKVQAEFLGRRLGSCKNIHSIYSSDLIRASETASSIAKFHRDICGGEVIVQKDSRLREIHLGNLQGKPCQLFQRRKFREEKFPGGGESSKNVSDRVSIFFSGLFWSCSQNSSMDSLQIIIVSHGGWISEALKFLQKLGCKISAYGKIENTAIFSFQVNLVQIQISHPENDSSSFWEGKRLIENRWKELKIESICPILINNIEHLREMLKKSNFDAKEEKNFAFY